MAYDRRITDIAAIAAVAAGKNARVAPQLLLADITFTLADAVEDGRIILGPAQGGEACHRQAAVQKARADALEEAAKVAESEGGDEIPLPGSERQMHGTYAQGAFAATQAIAAAIRSLTEREVSRG